MGDWASLADRVLRLKEFCAGIHAARSKTFFPKADSERSWDALTKRRGVTLRELVPKPVPDEMMEVMDNASGTLMGGTPHLAGYARVLHRGSLRGRARRVGGGAGEGRPMRRKLRQEHETHPTTSLWSNWSR